MPPRLAKSPKRGPPSLVDTGSGPSSFSCPNREAPNSILQAIWDRGQEPCYLACRVWAVNQLDTEAIARHGQTFATLPITAQDALIFALEHNRTATPWPAAFPAAAFINRLIDLAAEGFYADPANGGNRDGASWRMIGYDPLLPARPSAP